MTILFTIKQTADRLSVRKTNVVNVGLFVAIIVYNLVTVTTLEAITYTQIASFESLF
jgi:hypothetical protein